MKAVAPACPDPLLLTRTRFADYAELTKPRVSVLVLFTVAAGAALAARGMPDWALLFHTLFGTALVAAGASAGNQLLERHTDALMRRTQNRPLPSGRLQPVEVLVFAVVLGAGGVAYLLALLPRPTAALVAAFTALSYVFLYTPLKRITSLNTLVGAVPGALPPVIGWTAVHGSLDPEGMVLFLILFIWQVPHFLAIAWIYRDDYARAGLCMLPVIDRGGGMSGRQMVSYCLALIPASLTPAVLGLAGPVYVLGAVVLGIGFLSSAVSFTRQRTAERAWRVLRASLIYLPGLLALLLVDGIGTPLGRAWWPH
jgi:protoheme IX farnesyltransferase